MPASRELTDLPKLKSWVGPPTASPLASDRALTRMLGRQTYALLLLAMAIVELPVSIACCLVMSGGTGKSRRPSPGGPRMCLLDLSGSIRQSQSRRLNQPRASPAWPRDMATRLASRGIRTALAVGGKSASGLSSQTQVRDHLSRAAWRKSARSYTNGCIGVTLADGHVAVWNSEYRSEPVLVLTPLEWEGFVGGVRDGEFAIAQRLAPHRRTHTVARGRLGQVCMGPVTIPGAGYPP
jgi:hypothetical protein